VVLMDYFVIIVYWNHVCFDQQEEATPSAEFEDRNRLVFPTVNFLLVLQFFQTTAEADSIMAADYVATIRALPFLLLALQKLG